MIDVTMLRDAVDRAFARTGRGVAPWPPPHPDRPPLDEEYSRILDPGKWRILGARAEAWLIALAEVGLAVVEREVPIEWRDEPAPTSSHGDRATPLTDDALPLVVARSRLGDVDDSGVVLGVGDPAICVAWLPTCGCDACDGGSQEELDRIDDDILAVVAGRFRRLTRGTRQITILGASTSWSGHGPFGRRYDPTAVLADPVGWHEVSGPPWSPP